jgi:hypothetical protein
VKESYAVQAGKKAAAAQARRRKQWVTDRIMRGRLQGEGIKVKGLPVASSAVIGDDFF